MRYSKKRIKISLNNFYHIKTNQETPKPIITPEIPTSLTLKTQKLNLKHRFYYN